MCSFIQQEARKMNLFGYPLSALHSVLIVTHVLAALLALVVAPIAMATQKGGWNHRRWGKVYFWAMFVANAGALILLSWRFNIFLFGVTILSFYSALSGYRVIYRKRNGVGVGATRFDYGAAWVALITGGALLLWGVLTGLGITALWIPNDGSMFVVFVILPIVFGIGIAKDALTDLRSFRQPSTDRNWWWYYHIERMLGSYIGLTTALMVQQVGPRLPDSIAWTVWIAPTLIGTPAIAYWIKHYQTKFAQRRTAGADQQADRPTVVQKSAIELSAQG